MPSVPLMSEPSYRLLIEAGRAFDDAGEADEVLRRVTRIAAATVADLAVVVGVDATGAVFATALAAAGDQVISRDARLVAGAADRFLGSAEHDVERLLAQRGLEPVAELHALLGAPALHAFPLSYQGRRLGVLAVGRAPSRSPLSAMERDFLEAIGERAASAAEHARLQHVQQLARRKAELAEVRSKQLQRATAALAQAATPDQVAERAVRQAVAALAAARGRFVRRVRDEGREPHVLFEREGTPPLGNAATTHADQDGAVSGIVAEPVMIGETPVGDIELELGRGRTLEEDEQLLLRSIARETSAALIRVEAAQAQHDAREAAERANRAKSDFLAIMSHELRTPLSAIIGYTALLSDGITGEVTSAQHQQLTRISASARHLLAMIEDVLGYTQLEARTVQPELRRIDIADVVREAAQMIEPIIVPQGLTLDVGLPDAPVESVSDPRHVRQILLNLLSNAVKFTPPGGRVGVRVEARNGDIELAVSDTGIGIAQEFHAMVFEPFQQVDQRYSRRVGGVGVGLSIVRHLARGLGGSVTLDSAPGRGTTFIVRLPHRAAMTEPALRGADSAHC